MQRQDETLQMYTISLLLIAIRNSNLVIGTAVTINSCHSGHSDFFIIEKANYNINAYHHASCTTAEPLNWRSKMEFSHHSFNFLHLWHDSMSPVAKVYWGGKTATGKHSHSQTERERIACIFFLNHPYTTYSWHTWTNIHVHNSPEE